MVSIANRQLEEITVFDVEGELDIDSAAAIRDVTTKAHSSSDSHFLLWNFDKVVSISSSGVAILVDAFKELTKQGMLTKLINVGPAILDVFQVHKVLPIFNIHTDEGAALKQFQIDAEKKKESYVRLFERINVDIKARFKIFKQDTSVALPTHEAEVKTLSQCGVFLQTKKEYPPDTILDVTLLLPEGGTAKKPQVRILAKIVWIAKEETQNAPYPGMALSILYMEKSEKRKLEEFCVEHSN